MAINWKSKAIDLTQNFNQLSADFQDNPADTVVITGYSEITPLGNTEATEKAEIEGRSGTRKFEVNNFRTSVAAPIDFHPEDHFTEKELRGMSRIGALAVYLAREAGKMSGLLDDNGKLKQEINPLKTGNTISSGIGAHSKMVDAYIKINWKKDPETGKMIPADPKVGSSLLSPFTGIQLFPEEPNGDVEIMLGLQGWSVNSAEACATGLSSVADAYQLIKSGKNDIVFAGGVEDGLSERPDLSIGVFAAMRGPLTSNNDHPEKASRPFDRDRDGFVLAAGGGVLILERLESALARKAKIYAVVLSAEKGSDGYNTTNLNSERIARLILKTIKLPGEENLAYPIDSIFAHATSTKAGDLAEINTLRLTLGDENLRRIPITAIKSMHGHLAGGAGAINAITAIRSLEKGLIPPIINLENVDEPFKDLNLIKDKALKGDFTTALVLAYGFHGKDAVVLLGRYSPN